MFRAHLPVHDFELVDLSPPPLIADKRQSSATPVAIRQSDDAWLANSCHRAARCDVVVLSAEFAGRFFGAYGRSLSLQEMEEASCMRSCQGLFHAPREVFLLGCNTLATKDPDRRSPEEYLQVLLEHGFDRSAAERVVALRYGPLGPSFREAMRRIFVGVPRIYGFDSVAPNGGHSAKLLERYFTAKGDYRRYLDHSGRSAEANADLFAAYRDTDMVQVLGLTPGERATADRMQICALYDESRSVSDRLNVAGRLMDRRDFLSFLPSIEVFVRRHPAERMSGEELQLFDEIRRREGARDEVLRIVRGLDVSALKMEMANLAVNLQWMSRDEFRKLAFDSTRELLRQPISSEVVDIMCEISKHEPIGDAFESKDLPARLFESAEGLRFVDCLAPTDSGVDARMLQGLEAVNISTRLWAAYGLSRRVPIETDVLVRIAGHLKDPSPDVRAHLQHIFRLEAKMSDKVRRSVASQDPQLALELRTSSVPSGGVRPMRR